MQEMLRGIHARLQPLAVMTARTFSTVRQAVTPPSVFVIGGPGTGKGTLCEMLLKDLPSNSVLHINVGGLLRDELHNYRKQKKMVPSAATVAAGASSSAQQQQQSQPQQHQSSSSTVSQTKKMPSYGALLDEYLGSGRILPGYITAGIIRQKLETTGGAFPTPTIVTVPSPSASQSSSAAPSATTSPSSSSAAASSPPAGDSNFDFSNHPVYLIDGFPRTMDNVREYEARVGNAVALISLQCPPEVMVSRVLSRAAKSTHKRADDTEEVIKKRIEVFFSETVPVEDHFQQHQQQQQQHPGNQPQPQPRAGSLSGAPAKTLIKVDSNRPVEQVYQDFKKAFLSLLSQHHQQHAKRFSN